MKQENTVINVFISYGEDPGSSDFDKIKKTLNHLDQQEQNGYQLELFYDNYMKSKFDFDPEQFDSAVEEQLKNADVVLVLVSRGYFFSDYIYFGTKPIILKSLSDSCKIVPVLTEPPLYFDDWLFKSKQPIIPKRLNLINHKTSLFYPALWNDIQMELDAVFLGVAEAKNAVTEVVDPAPATNSMELLLKQLIFGFFMVFLFGFATFFMNKHVRAGEPTQEISRKIPNVDLYEQARTVGYYPSVSKEEYSSRSSDQSSNANSNFNSNAATKKVSPSAEKPSGNAVPREGYSNRIAAIKIEKESYGIYESCQGVNNDGFKPCKKGRRWFIVNESKNKHHEIVFDVETHENIYAIRPFNDGVAEVFFYNGKNMYLSFCLNLDDRKVNCEMVAYP